MHLLLHRRVMHKFRLHTCRNVFLICPINAGTLATGVGRYTKSKAQFLSAIRSIKVKCVVEGTIHHWPAVIAIVTAMLWKSVKSYRTHVYRFGVIGRRMVRRWVRAANIKIEYAVFDEAATMRR